MSSSEPVWRRPIARREFLAGIVVGVVVGRAARAGDSASASIFSAEDRRVLEAVSDVILPRDGELPAASETDLLAGVERWIASSPRRAEGYRKTWPALRRAVESRVPVVEERPDRAELERLCEAWYREHRKGSADPAAVVFEQLRRDLFKVYYASPEGWRAVGYSGPPMLPPPP